MYCAAWVECGSLVSCGHSHENVAEAVACMQTAGAFVLARDTGTMRSLDPAEEAHFSFAVRNSPRPTAVTGFLGNGTS
jgi:hypothetical protein